MTEQDRGQRALAERFWELAWNGPGIPLDDMDCAAAILGEHGVYLPDGDWWSSDAKTVAVQAELDRLHRLERGTEWGDLTSDSELERLQRIEAAARAVVESPLHTAALEPTTVMDALRAALEQD